MPTFFSRARTLIAAAFLTLAMSGSALAMPASLCVNPGGTGGCFAAIQDAIDHTGKAGSVVTISAGNYFEDLTIGKIKIDFEGESGTELFLGAGITIAAGAHVTVNRLDVQEGLSSCFTSSGSLTITNSNLFLCSGTRGGAIHQVGGTVTILHSSINGNSATENGGCLAMEGGKLSLQNVDLTSCFAVGDGGALWLSNVKATIVETGGEAHEPGSQISNNKANGSGGAILTSGGKVAIEGALIENNSAKGDGGAIRSSSALTITDTVLKDNSAIGNGGAILAQGGGKLTLTDGSISDNSARGQGGGIAAGAPFNLLNLTVVGNHATQSGGGGISASANGKIGSLTIDGNSASMDGGGIDVVTGTVKIANTIIAGNSAPMAFAQDCGGSFISQGFNLILDTTFCTISKQSDSDIIGDDPNLGAPGPFDFKIVQEPNPGSPVLGAGGHCPRTDEVLHTRPRKQCDIGAFESQ
jgi:predicted outer membrane repeat protein